MIPPVLTLPTHGMLTVLSVSGRKCIVRCSGCGSITEKWYSNVTTGKTQSCGCSRGVLISKAITVHGATETSEYKSWLGMNERCYNTNYKKYMLWGGRGITVCERWRHSFQAFLENRGWSDSEALYKPAETIEERRERARAQSISRWSGGGMSIKLHGSDNA